MDGTEHLQLGKELEVALAASKDASKLAPAATKAAQNASSKVALAASERAANALLAALAANKAANEAIATAAEARRKAAVPRSRQCSFNRWNGWIDSRQGGESPVKSGT